MEALFTPLVLYYAYGLLTQSPLEEHQFEEGDHIWCHVSGIYFKTIQHHGIVAKVEDVLGVIHFDGAHNDHWYVRRNCVACTDRLERRRIGNLGGRNVRFSCFTCFSRGQHLYRCEYGRSLGSVAYRELGSRSTQPPRPADEVAEAARAFYRDNFGEYSVIGRNCEDFARFCKIGDVGSKQWWFSVFHGRLVDCWRCSKTKKKSSPHEESVCSFHYYVGAHRTKD